MRSRVRRAPANQLPGDHARLPPEQAALEHRHDRRFAARGNGERPDQGLLRPGRRVLAQSAPPSLTQPEMRRTLRGKTVVITGASSGIGAEAARQFAALGATVAVVGRSKEKTDAVAQSVGGRSHLADFTQMDDVRRLSADLLADYEQIEILAN